MRRLGVNIPLEGLPVEESVVPMARFAEALGYTDVWSAESGHVDGLTPLAAVAATCPSLRLGTAILPIYTRPPALMAMSAAGLQLLSGGRFVLGLGTSTSIIVERWMGQSFTKPLARVRETVAVIREALAGKKVTFQGESIAIDGFRMSTGEVPEVPIYIAALGPKMLRLAGEIADGVILWLFTPEGVGDALKHVREGAEAVGRDPDSIDVVMRIVVAVDEDPQVLSYMMKRLATTYVMVDVYNASIRRQGFAAEADAVRRLWDAGDREGASSAISDELLNGIFIAGDHDSCRAKLERFREVGIKTPVLFPVSVDGDPEVRVERARHVLEAMAGA